ncbi:hypothetical protein MCETHM1_03340 [Flavobacteriaceae bacterium]|jgi:tetratricopeptide (TPR) repeat protein
MKSYLRKFLVLLLVIPSIFAQKAQIKEAQKELKLGNSENVIAVLSPIEYLIPNASNEDKIHFYYTKGTALLDICNKKNNSSKFLTQAINAFTDLIQIENETQTNKYSPEAIQSLNIIKEDLISSANEDLVLDNFSESSNKFFQAYLINKKDTLQLYNAAVSYKNALDADLSLKCFEELKTINYSGNIPIYIAFNRNTLTDEYFDTMDERDSKIQSGSHIKPRIVLSSKKPEIYKSIVLFYIQKGYKEKAMKVIEKARDLNYLDQSLAFIEANLYLETKDYDYFDKLAASIIESNPNNPEILITLGIKCQNEMYDTAAEYYYKKAIALDPNNLIAYVNLSALLVNKSIIITSKMNELGSLPMNKKSYEELKIQNEQINKMLVPYFQKIVSIDPFNSSVSQLISSVNMSKNNSNQSFASSDD